MFMKYLILNSSPVPLETLLFNSYKYSFEFKCGSKWGPKYLTWSPDLTDILEILSLNLHVSYSLGENRMEDHKTVFFPMFRGNLLA